MNDLDARIRAAVTELAEAAPLPKPLSTTTTTTTTTATSPDRSYRWVALAAASVLIVAGVAAIATREANRDSADPAATTPGGTLPVPDPVSTTAPFEPIPDPEETIPPTAPSAVDTPAKPTETGAIVDGPVVTAGVLQGGEEALLQGTLGFDGACLSLTDEPSGITSPVVWQAATTWDPTELVVVLPNGDRISIGDRIEAGGGSHPASELAAFGLTAEGIDTITRCTATRSPNVAVIQSTVTITPRMFEVTVGAAAPLTAGTIEVGPDDMLALRPDGDLWMYPDLLAGNDGQTPEPYRVYDQAEVDATVDGDTISLIDAAAGVLSGNAVFGVCCEPVSGMTMAVPDVDGASRLVTLGSRPVLHPSRPLIATIGWSGLTVADLEAGTTASASFLDDPRVVRSQVVWAGADGETLVVLGWDDLSWTLERFDPDDLSHRIDLHRLDLPSPFSSAGPVEVSLAGTDADGSVVVSVATPDHTRVLTADPDTLVTEDGANDLPSGVRVVRALGDRLIWLDGGVLMTARPGGEHIALAEVDAVDVWFASPERR